jgi:alginate O-acetyltransferase complex protein AlgI
MLIGYSMQIFADFAGYSLIAIAIGALFGYRLPENFNSPYLSQSFAEFWTRWHISLSSFLKEYLYIPLGGSRISGLRTYVNLFAVMLLGGLWHGAARSFMVWGGAHGAALAAERMVRDRIRLPEKAALKVVKILVVFSFVSFAWLLFKLTDFRNVVDYIVAIWHNRKQDGFSDTRAFIFIYSIPVVGYHLIRYFRQYFGILNRTAVAACLYGLMLFLIATNGGEPKSFVYFQF